MAKKSKEKRIIGILVPKSCKELTVLQNLLAENGLLIKTRLGFHEAQDPDSTLVGFILLELCGEPVKMDTFEKSLMELNGIDVQKMHFFYE